MRVSLARIRASRGWIFLVLFSLASCGKSGQAPDDPAPPIVMPLAGGITSVDDRSSNAYGYPAPSLSQSDLEKHLAGDFEFERTFVPAPAEINAGLGPFFNNSSCTKCHIRDGRGLPLTRQKGAGSQLIVRLQGNLNSASPHPLGGQIQDNAILGVEPEASITLRWTEQKGSYGDGEPYSLQRPVLEIRLPDGTKLPGNFAVSPRIPPPVFGLGLLEAVSDETLRVLTDPDDLNQDGISGRINELSASDESPLQLGRFGWKAGVSQLKQQNARAYREDMGLVTSLFRDLNTDLEVSDDSLDAVTFYVQTLGVPRRGTTHAAKASVGQRLFHEIACGSCHVETLSTDEHYPIQMLAGQTIHAYTDLLLHNMGFELADGFVEGSASGTEWRTPPLWGIGLAPTVLPGARYLHDGRARTLAEAILWHAGEAFEAKERFRLLPAEDRAALLSFLESL